MKPAALCVAFAVAMTVASCSRSNPNPPPASHEGTDEVVGHRRFGDLMTEVGRRFERAGRAVSVGRWDLADYDVGEIGEVFEDDVPHAIMPEEVHIDLHPIARAFANTYPAELQHAIAARDRAAFESAFARTAAQCNGCHIAAGKPFIQVPTVLGAEIPSLAPPTAPTPPSPSTLPSPTPPS